MWTVDWFSPFLSESLICKIGEKTVCGLCGNYDSKTLGAPNFSIWDVCGMNAVIQTSLACPHMKPSAESRRQKFERALFWKNNLLIRRKESYGRWRVISHCRQAGGALVPSDWMRDNGCGTRRGSLGPSSLGTVYRRKGAQKDRQMCHLNHTHGSNPVLPWVISMGGGGSQLLYLLNRALQPIWKHPRRSLAIRCYQLLSFLDICLKNILLKGIAFPAFGIWRTEIMSFVFSKTIRLNREK